MSEHSKGPELEYGAECGDIREEGNNLIADLYLDGRGTVAEATARRDALGRKMAAAPELVEALSDLLATSGFDNAGEFRRAVLAAKAALKKAGVKP